MAAFVQQVARPDRRFGIDQQAPAYDRQTIEQLRFIVRPDPVDLYPDLFKESEAPRGCLRPAAFLAPQALFGGHTSARTAAHMPSTSSIV